MKKLFQWCCVALMAVVLVACGGGGGSAGFGVGQEVPTKAKTTLLVYMVASDLVENGNGPGWWTLNGMLAARSSEDVNVILQVGGGSGPGPVAGVDMRETRRYRLKPAPANANANANVNTEVGAAARPGWTIELLPQSQQPRTVAMNHSETLRDFVQWGASSYPAQQYHLVLYDHGGGPVGGYGNDMANSDGAGMSVSDIAKALKDSPVHFELLGFDACLMANLEVASLLAPYANYLAATEDVTLFWDWNAILNFMVAHPLAPGDQLGQEIVRSYKATQVIYPWQADFVTTSVTDLRQVPALVSAVGAMTASLEQAIDQEGLPAWLQIAHATRQARSFQTNIYSKRMDLVDLLSWTRQLAAVGVASSEHARAVEAALRAAVVFVDEDEDEETNGLSLYFPRYSLLDEPVTQRYLAQGYPTEITQLVHRYTQFARSGQLPQIQVNAPVLQGAEIVSTVDASSMTQTQPFDGVYAVLARDGVFHAVQEVEPQNAQIRLPQALHWPQLNGQMVSLLRMKETQDEVYSIPVLTRDGLNPNAGTFKPGTLLVGRNSAGQLQVFASVDQQVVVGAAFSVSLLEPEQTFLPIRASMLDGSLSVDRFAPLVAPQGDWIVEMAQLSDPGYTLFTAASDLTGELQWSPAGLPVPVAP